ncbi:E3 ubiquitin-protein ligase [Sodiomyces alkalinus F11]|uniref:E3 ubiquitin-protein ligase n=1 Tax=Sodiomyces alkalinus (strain CBS 110278 / VKM F-3762 / F11) TaxID=1314773 RepID=A0A3N2Q8N9_SODAK|nr:E3 ubiquitin-protein ligase [Sodiomyces alkalinus F11]ROT43122.1 E3 ubiquitin-protein ligase [Sodiomyces alkalinus F11]
MPAWKTNSAMIPQVGPNDDFPPKLVNAVAALPCPGLPTEDICTLEPPSKKIKLVANPVESRLIDKQQLSITRRCDDALQVSDSIVREDVGDYLRLRLDTNGKTLGISLKPRRKGGREAFSILVALRPGSVSRQLETCIRVLGAKESREDEGALWTYVDIRLERYGKSLTVIFCIDLYWNITTHAYRLRTQRQRQLSDQVISTFFPGEDTPTDRSLEGERWTPLDFYESAHVPSPSETLPHTIEVPGLTSTLYPYQKRTLQWLLNREGVCWVPPSDGDGPRVEEILPRASSAGARSFSKVTDFSGQRLSLSRLYHVIAVNTSPFADLERSVKGGILAEEMGLGKTLEIIGLILLHQRQMEDGHGLVDVNGEQLVRSRATIIVCPESLRQQWMTELQLHAPSLQVCFYRGRAKAGIEGEEELVRHLASQDVVITTYNTLSAEIHFATKPPDRSRRRERAFPRPKSPLVQISWWRVCLDEAQMIESGVSSAALVARVLHRINAWGVTGTPVKSDVKDLLGLLLFLKYEPFCSAPQVWKALAERHKPLFRSLFNELAIRHTKHLVRDELELPSQKRFVITMPFTAVEEQHYRSLFKEMAEACGVHVDGSPKVDDWQPGDYEEQMRSWLNRLRQTALHPEVGAQNRRALGRKTGPLRTVDEVLNTMIEQSEASIRAEQRVYFHAKLCRGQMLENGPRVKEALAIWEDVRDEVDGIVSKCQAELRVAIDEARQRAATDGKRLLETEASEESEMEDEADDSQGKGRVAEARMRLRLAWEVQHKAVFFCANAYFQITSDADLTRPDSEEFKSLQRLEDEGYEAAKRIRREILSENHRKATKHIRRLQNLASSQNFVTVPELVPNPLKGIESGPVIEKIEDLYGALNTQADIIDAWRERLVQLLTRPLVDQEEHTELTGDEFADSTKIQEELMVHVQVLRAIVADRLSALSGLENPLVKHETRTTKALAKNGEGPAPEKLLELLAVRDEVRPPAEQGCLRGTISELRALAGRLAPSDASDEGRTRMEHEVVTRQIKDTLAQMLAQSKACQGLERECDKFTSAMNARLDYYRQLQYVSDSVETYEGPRDDVAIAKCVESEEISRKKLGAAEAKHRYLLSLRDTGSRSSEPRMCIICQSTFTTGILTVCGHQFCRECMMLWFKANHNCPMCKRQLRISELHDITIRPRELKLHNQDGPDPVQGREPKHSPASKKTGIYTEFGAEKLEQIYNIELEGPSFTTKVDAIVRHILWLRESDPGAKSIIFSQYRDFLGVIGLAFSRFRIGYTSFDQTNGIQSFKEDAGIECFLLHGRAQSSGLNLVNASHVFLCEPVLNTALELQAIARVDRIGQRHQTTVWLYLIEGTVEESIYNLSVKRRMEHIGQSSKGKSKESTPEVLEPALEAANTLEMEQASLSKLMSKDKTAGESVDKDDLWECLFGHVAKSGNSGRGEELLENPAVRGFLAAEAAEERQRSQASI